MDDGDARAAFCVAEHPRLVGTLSLYCGDRWLAEELAQETLARVCRDWARVGVMHAPGAWAHRVAINLANSWFRRRAAERRAHRRGRVDDVHRDADGADTAAVRAAVAGLPRRQRAAVVLRYYADLPAAEVAVLMGCAEGTVRALTHQGLAGMRLRLDDPLDDPPEDPGDRRPGGPEGTRPVPTREEAPRVTRPR